MHGDPLSEERDLRRAAEVFLRGPVPIGTRPAGEVEIGAEAVTQVAAHLAACDPTAVSDIKAALDWHRRVGTTASRQVLIDAVAAAVAVQGLTKTDRRQALDMRTP